MLGAIIGDTVGSHYEFHNTKDYHFKLFAEKYPCPMGDYGGLFRQWLFTPEAAPAANAASVIFDTPAGRRRSLPRETEP